MKNLFGKTLGYIFLVLVIVISVLSSIFIKSVYKDYPKPFAFTYFNFNFLVILIFVYFIKQKIKLYAFNNNQNNQIIKSEEEKDLIDNFNNLSEKINKKPTSLMAVIILALLWYTGNAFYNLGLSYNNISFSNSLSNLAIIFILLEKITCFKGKCSLSKIIGVVFALLGLILITIYQKLNEKKNFFENESILGDLFIVFGAFFYSLYAVSLKYFSKMNPCFDMMLTFGLMGLFTLIVIPILLIVLALFEIEQFEFPSWIIFIKIFLNALFASLISDLLQSYSVILLSPHLVSFGLILTIPLSISYDLIFPEKNKEIHINIYFILGTIFLIISFIVVVYENYLKIQNKNKKLNNSTKEEINKT